MAVFTMTMLSCLSLSIVVELVTGQNYMPVFLFAGQSNMIGFSSEAGSRFTVTSGGKLGLRLSSLVNILGSDATEEQKRRALVRVIQRVEESVRDEEVAIRESNALLEMHEQYPTLFGSIETPMDNVFCSWITPPGGSGRDENVTLKVATNISTRSKCGGPWGSELVVGHTLSTYNQFAIAKVARGGTEIYKDWTGGGDDADPRFGNCWNALKTRIQNLDSVHPNCANTIGGRNIGCKWQGIVYFQGENDSFAPTTALHYLANLTNLIDNARSEMYDAGSAYDTPEAIPVVIVQIGCWPQGFDYGPTVMEAQAQFVEETPHSALVYTADLSCFYHFETASHLIIGHRVARAMESLLA